MDLQQYYCTASNDEQKDRSFTMMSEDKSQKECSFYYYYPECAQGSFIFATDFVVHSELYAWSGLTCVCLLVPQPACCRRQKVYMYDNVSAPIRICTTITLLYIITLKHCTKKPQTWWPHDKTSTNVFIAWGSKYSWVWGIWHAATGLLILAFCQMDMIVFGTMSLWYPYLNVTPGWQRVTFFSAGHIIIH